jgi:predicted RND superfamily exporter protein
MSGLSEQEDRFLGDAMVGLVLCLTGIFLVLAWIFASWTRPLVVMAIIPFGLVGTIFGHAYWDVPLSMFTVVGLLGMTGIIINDSIVLISTIDGYAKERGLIPSIIDGAVDRLRPVILTTLTTVLGLAPLLYEQSQAAQFLKPTVITLVYGLGFGMLLVLFVVPALVAAQNDFARPLSAMRRALRTPGNRLRGLVIVAALALACWFGGTIGWQVVNGTLPDLLLGIVPDGGFAQAFVLFAAGAALFLLLTYLLAALWFSRRAAKAT